ncbi:MAG: hypothetical protein U5P10_13965 [Spirochaetia bacterium]|nr:hypothetical protein [Spirochaetia bacterium]
MYRITIFHYHLLTGGITQVITSSVKALLQQQPDQFDITLVCGRDSQRTNIVDKIEQALKSQGVEAQVHSRPIPEIDYLVEQDTPPKVEDIKQKLNEHFSDSIWWVHNYHIGKNPLFTEALLQIAREQPQQQIILHIHDFPESGRFSNLKALYENLESPMYPVSPNVRYIVINSRDRNVLRDAGIPEDQLFLLNNPIEPHPSASIDSWQVQQKIETWAGEHTPGWEPEGKLLLYPVRSIRRKNVLEAGLLTNLVESPTNLLVTLPGVSQQERAYSNLVESAYQNRLISGAWGIGRNLDEIGISFEELTRSADVIVSTAIQEGFGYLFINSVLWGTPLVARDLDILGALKDYFLPQSSYFYSQLQVPLSTGDRAALGDTYSQILNSVAGLLPDDQHKRIRYEVEQLLAERLIDYSFLSVEQQYQVLRQAAESPEFVLELREINAETVATMENLLRGPQVKNRDQIIKQFGAPAHTKAIESLLASFNENQIQEQAGDKTEENTEGQSSPAAEDPIHRKVLQSFNHLQYCRPRSSR